MHPDSKKLATAGVWELHLMGQSIVRGGMYLHGVEGKRRDEGETMLLRQIYQMVQFSVDHSLVRGSAVRNSYPEHALDEEQEGVKGYCLGRYGNEWEVV